MTTAATTPRPVRPDLQAPGATIDDPVIAAPADPSTRIELLDALRGFALFGVCLANLMQGFAFWGEPAAAERLPHYAVPALDGAARFLMLALVEGKFYSVFSLLFGLGFALQMQRAASKGDDGLSLFGRRLRVLMAIGLAHILFWNGDILLFYALLGLVLVRMRHFDDRRLLQWVVALVLLPIVFHLPMVFVRGLSLGTPLYMTGAALEEQMQLTVQSNSDFYRYFVSGSLAEFAKLNLAGVFFRFGYLLMSSRAFKVLAMFLLGMLVGRHRMWSRLDEHAPLLRRVAAWGIGFGLPVSITWSLVKDGQSWLGLLDATLYAFSVAPLAIGYAAAFALLWRRDRGRRLLGWFAPAGRMALTNYLMQSVIATAIFSGLGFAMAGRISPTWIWVLAITIIAAQVAYSRWWLARFRFGPMEWVWRSFTYRSRQGMRR